LDSSSRDSHFDRLNLQPAQGLNGQIMNEISVHGIIFRSATAQGRPMVLHFQQSYRLLQARSIRRGGRRLAFKIL